MMIINQKKNPKADLFFLEKIINELERCRRTNMVTMDKNAYQKELEKQMLEA
jgi:hypothetical protein